MATIEPVEQPRIPDPPDRYDRDNEAEFRREVLRVLEQIAARIDQIAEEVNSG